MTHHQSSPKMLTEKKIECSEKPSSIAHNNNDAATLTSGVGCGSHIADIGQPLCAQRILSSSIGRRLSATGKLPFDYDKPPFSNCKLSPDSNKLPFVNVELPLDAAKLDKLSVDRDKRTRLPHNKYKLPTYGKLPFDSDKLPYNTEIPPCSDKVACTTEKNVFSNGNPPSDSNKPPCITEKPSLTNGLQAPDSASPCSVPGSPPPPSPPAPEGEECAFNLERILCELGSFGKYQLVLLALLAFRDSFLQMCNYNYVFTAAEVNFRCVVPECESGDDLHYEASFVQFALPNLTNTCYRLASRYAAGGGAALAGRQWNASDDVCSAAAFVGGQRVACERRVYEDYSTLYAEFDLGCTPWKRTLIGTVHNLGLLFSYLISGLISDRFGRKVIIVGTPLVVGVAGLLKSFAQSYWTVLVLEFVETALGYGNASMVLSLELVCAADRVVFSCAADAAGHVGGALLGALAALAGRAGSWRVLLRAIYTPLLCALAYCFLMDEGVRWLVAHGRREEAARVLHKVAKYNNVTLSRRAASMLHDLEYRTEKEPESMRRCELVSALCSRKIVLRVLLLAACFLCCLFVYSGSIIYSTSLTGDRFVNFSTMWLVGIPSRVLAALALSRWGRRAPLAAAYVLCALSFLASAFVPPECVWVVVSLYALGAMCSSFGVFGVTVFALELLPTRARNSLLNLATTAGRLGTVLAPQAPLLARVWRGLPLVSLGACALCAAALCGALPDTARADLPDRVQDAETLPPAATAVTVTVNVNVVPTHTHTTR